jgi:protein-disulfide isomerase
MKTRNKRRRIGRRTQSTIDAFLSLATLVAIGVVIWNNWPAPPPPPVPLPAEPIALDGAATKGQPAGTVIMIEYSDFECPHCGAFARQTLPTVEQQYVATGKVRLAYRHVTPPGHRRALPAAIAADCAGQQGKFWEMHDRLFADQTKLDDASLAAHARALALDAVAFKTCQADPASADRIARDMAQARSLRIAGTPAFLIGAVMADGRVKVTRSLRGAVPLSDLQKALDAELGGGVLAWLFSGRHPAGLAGVGATAIAVAGLAFGYDAGTDDPRRRPAVRSWTPSRDLEPLDHPTPL